MVAIISGQVRDQIPAGCLGPPEQIARAACFPRRNGHGTE